MVAVKEQKAVPLTWLWTALPCAAGCVKRALCGEGCCGEGPPAAVSPQRGWAAQCRGVWRGRLEDPGPGSANRPLSPVPQKSKLQPLPHQAEQEDSTKFVVLTLTSIAAMAGVLLASGVIYCLRHSSHHRLKEKLSGLGGDLGPDATAAYQVKRGFLLHGFTRLCSGPGPSPTPSASWFTPRVGPFRMTL